MKPVLPAFQGNLPMGMHTLFPTANISRVGKPVNPLRDHFAAAAWVDALDPLFATIADKFMATLIADFGTDHYYAADGTFSHSAAPWMSLSEALADPTFRTHARAAAAAAAAASDADLHDDAFREGTAGPTTPPPPAINQEAFQHSKAAYAGMTRTDPDAKWVYQTWSWLGGTLGEAYYRGWITAVPKGSIILLDLMAEESPLFEQAFIKNYYGAPFIWCMLNDFGGNTGLWGDWRSITANPPRARASAPNMIGTGLTMEGVFQNAATFDLMNENSYRSAAVADVKDWAATYSYRRYNSAVPAAAHAAAKAWRLFAGTAFNVSDGEMVSKDTLYVSFLLIVMMGRWGINVCSNC